MVSTPLYTYSPIRHDQIRLLKFTQDGDYISATLKAFSIDQPLPPYYPVTYTWTFDGKDDHRGETIMMEMEGSLLPVPSSLGPFFDVLRAKGTLLDGTWWWIDSVCIQQSNFDERAHQVKLMQLIYRQATQTIAWLGESTSDSDLAMDFVDFLDETTRQELSVAETRSLLLKDQYLPQWAAFKNLLSRKWWSRIWTVQEFVLPRSVSVWCGMRSASRVAVCNSVLMADKCNPLNIKDDLAFAHANNRRRPWILDIAERQPGVDLNMSLVALAAYFCCMDATDDRDRLYGLMALSTDKVLLRADYLLSTEEVYLRFAQSFIEQHKSLDIICLASVYSAPSGSSRPSWVPDWQKRSPQVIPCMASQSSRTHIGNLRGPGDLQVDPSIYYAASKDTPANCRFEGSALFTQGVIIDTVDGLAGSRHSDMAQSSEWNSTQPAGRPHSAGLTEDVLMSVCRSLVLDRKDRYLRYTMPTADFFSDFVRLLAPILTTLDSSGPEKLQEWFQWTRSLRIQGRSFEDILRDGLSAGVDSSDAAAPNQDEYYHSTFFGRFFDTVVRLSLRLMVSRNGHIGMTVEKAMKGDLICVLFGCSIPVLLRRTGDGNTFRLIGECFLDGWMDGSALVQPGLEEQEFVIV